MPTAPGREPSTTQEQTASKQLPIVPDALPIMSANAHAHDHAQTIAYRLATDKPAPPCAAGLNDGMMFDFSRRVRAGVPAI